MNLKTKKSNVSQLSDIKAVNAYIQSFPKPVRTELRNMRGYIRYAAPGAKESMMVNVPASYDQAATLKYGAFKDYIGFYPTPRVVEVFKDRLTEYKINKGSVQFSYNKPLLVRPIRQMTQSCLSKSKWRKKRGSHSVDYEFEYSSEREDRPED